MSSRGIGSRPQDWMRLFKVYEEKENWRGDHTKWDLARWIHANVIRGLELTAARRFGLMAIVDMMYYHKIDLATPELECYLFIQRVKRRPHTKTEAYEYVASRTGLGIITVQTYAHRDGVDMYDAQAVEDWIIMLGPISKGTLTDHGLITGKNRKIVGGQPTCIWQPDALPHEHIAPKDVAKGKQFQFLSADEDWVDIDGGKGSGKRLHIETPLPTPSGWVKMGEVKEGDKVFDESGNACTVVYASEIAPGDSFRVKFSDGSVLLADADHLWEVESYRSRKRTTGSIVMTTAQMSGSLARMQGKQIAHNYSVRNTLPLHLPDADLPVDPYILGIWLGDGNNSSPIVTVGKEDEADLVFQLRWSGISFKKLSNVETKAPQFYLHGWTTRWDGKRCLRVLLKQMDLLQNKHIPSRYLRSSERQRHALLQGLLDSDGSCANNCQVEFYNSNKRLALDCAELTASLGLKYTFSSKQALLNGKEYGETYTVRFTPIATPFRLPRKLLKLRTSRTQKERRVRRYITEITRIDSVPMRCIAVDSPSHLYLAGKSMIPTHNTDLLIMDCVREEKLSNPVWHGVIFRREYKRLQEVIDRAHYWFSKMKQLKAHWQGQHSRFIFPSGAWLAFHNVQNEGEEEQYQGWQICDLKFDQLEEFTEAIFNYLVMQNRSGDPERLHSTVRWTANPMGEGHAWVKRRFVDGKEPGRRYVTKAKFTLPDGRPVEIEKTYKRIFATVFDNPLLRHDQNYIATLATITDPVLRKAMFLGDWSVIAGQFFSTFTTNVHVLRNSSDIKLAPQWSRLGGLDYGNVKTLEILARDGQSNVYCEWEYRSEAKDDRPAATAGEFGEGSAAWMMQHEIGEALHVIGDVNMWTAVGQDVGTKRVPAEIVQQAWTFAFSKAGLIPPKLIPVSKSGTEDHRYRVACNEAVKEYLRYELSPIGEVTRPPKLFFLDRCVSIINTLPMLKGDPARPLDFIKNHQFDDHDYDAFKAPFMLIHDPKAVRKEKTAQEKWDDQQRFAGSGLVIVPGTPTGDYRIDF